MASPVTKVVMPGGKPKIRKPEASGYPMADFWLPGYTETTPLYTWVDLFDHEPLPGGGLGNPGTERTGEQQQLQLWHFDGGGLEIYESYGGRHYTWLWSLTAPGRVTPGHTYSDQTPEFSTEVGPASPADPDADSWHPTTFLHERITAAPLLFRTNVYGGSPPDSLMATEFGYSMGSDDLLVGLGGPGIMGNGVIATHLLGLHPVGHLTWQVRHSAEGGDDRDLYVLTEDLPLEGSVSLRWKPSDKPDHATLVVVVDDCGVWEIDVPKEAGINVPPLNYNIVDSGWVFISHSEEPSSTALTWMAMREHTSYRPDTTQNPPLRHGQRSYVRVCGPGGDGSADSGRLCGPGGFV